MATCEACGGVMAEVFSCPGRADTVTRYGFDLPAEQYRGAVLPFRCRDCAVAQGERHHPWCCVAGCLVHAYEQRMVCGCDE